MSQYMDQMGKESGKTPPASSHAQTSIARPQLLQIQDRKVFHWGGNQLWYAASWRRQAGCGPTTCAHLLWYLAQTRTDCRALCDWDASTRTGFLRLMDTVWNYVTPGMMGLNSTALFADGAVRYAAARGVALTAHTLEIPRRPADRMPYHTLAAFLRTAFAEDAPVAFLNLSNGALANLESWHWVTLVALEEHGAVMLDQGGKYRINLLLWLQTTAMGGGLVYLSAGGR